MARRNPQHCEQPPGIGSRAGGVAAALLALCLIPAPAAAEWQNFKSAAGGLASNAVRCLLEDRDGSVWVGTDAGACRFDGTRWATQLDSLPDRRVSSLLRDRQGRLWFGTVAGAAVLDGGAWRRYDASSPELPDPTINALCEDHRGDVWLGTGGGLVRHQPGTGTWTTLTPSTSGLVDPRANHLLEDRQHRLWIGTPLGLSMLDSTRTQWTTFRSDPSALGRDSVLSLGEDPGGNVWVGTDQGVWRYGAAGWDHWTGADGLPGNVILSIAADRSGRIWLGGLNGVSHGDGVTFRYDNRTSDGQLVGPVASLLVDGSGNVWMGGLTYEYLGVTSQGVFRFDGVAWRNYFFTDPSAGCFAQPSPNIPTSYPLPGNCMTAGLQDRAGELWFGTLDTGLARLGRAGNWSTLRRGFARPLPDSISAMVEDRQGTLWFASPGSGLVALDSTRTAWTPHSQASGLPSDDVRTLFVDGAGELWAGTASGAARRAVGGWTRYALGGPPAEVQRFAEDATGRLWVLTLQGLWSVDPARTQVKQWTTADGLPDDYPTALLAARNGAMWFGTTAGVSRFDQGTWTSWPGNSVSALREAPNGDVWAGTSLDARRWNGSSWEVHSWPQAVPGTPVKDIAFEPNGTVWAATPAGVGRYDGRSWKKLDSRGNGLTVDEIVGVVTDTQQRMWVLGLSGLAEYEPDLAAPQTVFVNTNEKVSPSRNVSLVFGAAYGELADLEYMSQWDGQPWSDWTADNTWYRQGVADGPHTFSVRSRDWAGNVDPTPATYAFEIDATPPAAEILAPAAGLPVRGTCAIVGSTADARFLHAAVEARPLGAATWTYTLASGDVPVTADTLATWDTAALPDGDWEIRVAVDDTLGLTGVARIRVIVDNVAPFANVTSPVRLVAGEGGDVFTTNAEAHLYFPPNAFDADPVVNVDSVTAGGAPDTLPGGPLRRGPAWSIGWTGGALRKDGVLELRPWAGGGDLAVWRRQGAGAWERLGGSPQDGGALALTLSGPGQYALFAQPPAAAPGGGLSALTLTPRAFSPRGGFATSEVAIGFSLARPGAATVKLYNRAGRLVRVIASGMGAVAGGNLVRWNGRDDDGRLVDAGLYLVTVEALGGTLTKPLAVVQ